MFHMAQGPTFFSLPASLETDTGSGNDWYLIFNSKFKLVSYPEFFGLFFYHGTTL
mgnify:FL=1